MEKQFYCMDNLSLTLGLLLWKESATVQLGPCGKFKVKLSTPSMGLAKYMLSRLDQQEQYSSLVK